MLHAIAKSKSTIYKRYLGHRDESEIRVCEEDEITSTVFGPLQFLESAAVTSFWRHVFSSHPQGAFLLVGSPDSVDVAFWPSRFKEEDQRKRVEPDMLIQFRWPGGESRIILVEIKWRAPLSGQDQLKRQWKEFLGDDERCHALHVFLAPTVAEGACVRAQDDVWIMSDSPASSAMPQDRLLLLTWLDIRSTLTSLTKTEGARSALGRWAAVSDAYLKKLQIRAFKGFDKIPLPVCSRVPQDRPVFWQPHRFAGFSRLDSSFSNHRYDWRTPLFFSTEVVIHENEN